MARMRYIKPEYWTDSVIVRLSPWARLLYIGTWNFALCDHGHLEDDALQLKMKVFPADNVDIDATLGELVAAGRITRLIGSDGRRYLHIARLDNHQKTDPRFTPRCPACNDDALTSDDAPSETLPSLEENGRTLPNSPTLSDSLPQEGKGREGRGGEGKSATRSPRRRSPETPIPDDWSPNATARAKASELGVDLNHEAQQFRNHALTHDRRCVRWDTAFLNWLGNVRTRPTGRPTRLTTDDRVRAGLELAQQIRAEEQRFNFPQIGAAS